MRQWRIPAVFMRGGTSKAVMFSAEDLPADRAAWDAIFLFVPRAPDRNGRQSDGRGGGVSSLSKVGIGIAHAAGVTVLGALVDPGPGGLHCRHAVLDRTARHRSVGRALVWHGALAA